MIVAALLLAATADLSVLEVAPAKTSVLYDETFSFSARVHNAGPDAAEQVRVTIGGNGSTFLRGITAPPGWTCDPVPRYAAALTCTAPTLASGAEARFTMTLTAPQPTANTYRVGASVNTISTDPRRTNNVLEADIGLVAPARTAGLSVTGRTTTNPVRESGEIHVTFDVHNAGPDDARDVLVLIAANAPFTASGAGWSCTGNTCSRDELRAGTTSTIEVRGKAPSAEMTLPVTAYVRAEQIFDSDRRDNEATVTIGVGRAENWERLLIPVADSFVPGSGGARWTTEISALLLADHAPQFAPHPCEHSTGTCAVREAPVRQQFDAFQHLITDDNPTGQYFYVRPWEAPEWRFNARIRDAARVEQTAGAEMPIVRDSAFRSDTIALLNVPVAPQYRHTLRIYDDAGRDRVRAAVRIYSGGETSPRVSVVRELVRAHNRTTTTALLPTHPAYAQMELAQLGSLAGLESLRVEVEPLDPGVRLWAFISIVNNETHHVTVVTPQ